MSIFPVTRMTAVSRIIDQDISLAGENVEITSKDNVYHSDEKHEYKKSGLGVSIGGSAINAKYFFDIDAFGGKPAYLCRFWFFYGTKERRALCATEDY